ncbi:HAD family phosphatase [Brachymonas sp. G13]|uniref:HAD family hydrolase n=1 Tax=Brachymonas TaxID=28219 RepID=UPI00169E29C0|nr:HAD family phosphatase [Brachymonas sp. J145]MEE1654114.1 HAD family phosphatase [Brachymonas sp. J145]NLX16684.1 HAD-IB family hydrolase [Ramlibacter sp.]
MKIALFDLDHTLLPIDSDFMWTHFTNAIGWTDAEDMSRQNEAFYEQYEQGVLDMNEYVRFVTRAIREHTPEEAHAAHARYLTDYVQPAVHPAALELLQQHRDAGDTLVLITATNRFIAGPIGTLLGFDEQNIIATELERGPDGWFTGNVEGMANLREGKVHNMTQWLTERKLDWCDTFITFYSDSINDAPLMERADVPVATNPDERLRMLAEARGWRILDLFPKA